MYTTDRQRQMMRERSHGQINYSYKKQHNLITKSFCHPNERCEIMLRLTLPPYLIRKKAKISQKL